MNFISIILYLGSVIDKMVPLAATGMVFSIILVGALSLYIADSGAYHDTTGPRKARKIFIWSFFITLPIVIFTPSSEIIYLIAASELGEEVVTNPEVVEVATELKDVIIGKLKSIGE